MSEKKYFLRVKGKKENMYFFMDEATKLKIVEANFRSKNSLKRTFKRIDRIVSEFNKIGKDCEKMANEIKEQMANEQMANEQAREQMANEQKANEEKANERKVVEEEDDDEEAYFNMICDLSRNIMLKRKCPPIGKHGF